MPEIEQGIIDGMAGVSVPPAVTPVVNEPVNQSAANEPSQQVDAGAGQPPAEPEPEPEPEFDIKLAGQDRKVKLSQLTNTYGQFEHLQQKHLQLKPLIDSMERAGLTPEQIVSMLNQPAPPPPPMNAPAPPAVALKEVIKAQFGEYLPEPAVDAMVALAEEVEQLKAQGQTARQIEQRRQFESTQAAFYGRLDALSAESPFFAPLKNADPGLQQAEREGFIKYLADDLGATDEQVQKSKFLRQAFISYKGSEQYEQDVFNRGKEEGLKKRREVNSASGVGDGGRKPIVPEKPLTEEQRIINGMINTPQGYV